MTLPITLAILIPLLGTTLGASMVLVLKNNIRPSIHKMLVGFASGVMVAASVWSLLLPAIDKSVELGVPGWMPPSVGFMLGILFLLLLDTLIPHLHAPGDEPEGIHVHARKNTMLMLAVTLHNIPEGMAVGVVFAGLIEGSAGITFSSALALAIGIAIQNFPEGAIISMPPRSTGMSRKKAFLAGTASGVVEPLAAFATVALTHIMVPILPYLLAFAAGAMMYVVVEELVPQLQEGTHSNIGIIGFAVGFTVMMILDVALG